MALRGKIGLPQSHRRTRVERQPGIGNEGLASLKCRARTAPDKFGVQVGQDPIFTANVATAGVNQLARRCDQAHLILKQACRLVLPLQCGIAGIRGFRYRQSQYPCGLSGGQLDTTGVDLIEARRTPILGFGLCVRRKRWQGQTQGQKTQHHCAPNATGNTGTHITER